MAAAWADAGPRGKKGKREKRERCWARRKGEAQGVRVFFLLEEKRRGDLIYKPYERGKKIV
jgi:hypothetical protein